MAGIRAGATYVVCSDKRWPAQTNGQHQGCIAVHHLGTAVPRSMMQAREGTLKRQQIPQARVQPQSATGSAPFAVNPPRGQANAGRARRAHAPESASRRSVAQHFCKAQRTQRQPEEHPQWNNKCSVQRASYLGLLFALGCLFVDVLSKIRCVAAQRFGFCETTAQRRRSTARTHRPVRSFRGVVRCDSTASNDMKA